MEKRYRFGAGDVLGGFAGAAVALPQSMGLGIALFSVMGLDSSTGAMAGLTGAAILLTISGLAGATIGIMSAPNGPMTMLLAGVMGSLKAAGADSSTMLAALAAILILTGFFQIVFALVGGAQLIKYIPFPVVAGLISGIGILMIKSQWNMLSRGWDSHIPSGIEEAFPLIAAFAAAIFMYLTPHISKKKIPGAVGALFGGMIFFYLLLSIAPFQAHTEWMVGEIPSLTSPRTGFSLDLFGALPVETVISSALALMVLGTTDSLVTSLVADSKTGERHNSKKEIIAQGTAEILTGLFGGLGGWGTKGATLVAIDAGGRRWSAVCAGVFFLILMLFAGAAGRYLPVSVLAGIVAMVGAGMIDLNILSWMRHKRTRIDSLVALSVVIAIMTLNVVSAVGTGVLISIMLFVVRQTRNPIVHRVVSGKEHRSLRVRSKEAMKCLDQYGDEILMYELKGDLFFATADKLRNMVSVEIEKRKVVILHFRRVNYIDLSAMIVLLQISQDAASKDCRLLFCHLHKGLGFGKKITKAFRRIDSSKEFNGKVFRDTDRAFEYAEDILLENKGFGNMPEDIEIPFQDNNLCQRMTKEQIELVESAGRVIRIRKKDELFKKGDYGESIYLVLKGEIEMRLYADRREYKRLAKYEPGTYFGEVSFVNPGPRTANAVALKDSKLLEVKREILLDMGEGDRAQLSLALLWEIGTTLSDELRRSAADIQRLEQW